MRVEGTFRACVSFAAVSLAPKNIDRAIALIDDLEDVSGVAEITQLLAPELAT